MYKKMNSLNFEASNLRESNQNLAKKNRNNEKKLRLLREAQEVFANEYEFTIRCSWFELSMLI